MKAESKSTGSTVAATQAENAPPPTPQFEAERLQKERDAAPDFQIGISDEGDPVVWAADEKAFRSGMALEAVKRASNLLTLARRAGLARMLAESHWANASGLDDMLNRAINLLTKAEYITRATPGDSMHDYADEILGSEFLIGKLAPQGAVVVDL